MRVFHDPLSVDYRRPSGAVPSGSEVFLKFRAEDCPDPLRVSLVITRKYRNLTSETELGASSYGVPFTVGLGIRFYVAPRLSIGTGLDYSLLSRTFSGSVDGSSGSVSHTMQYLGIPVNLYYDIISSDRIKFYAFGGGEAEYCISNKYRLFGTPDIVRTPRVSGLQYSVGAGLGVEFRIGGRVGLYVDPGVNYYFNCNQPRNIRTEKPFLLNFDAGLRFNF